MSEWRELLVKLDDLQPSPGLVEDALRRAHTAPRRNRRLRRHISHGFALAAIGVGTVALLVALAFAAHLHRNSQPAQPPQESSRQAMVADAELLSARAATITLIATQKQRPVRKIRALHDSIQTDYQAIKSDLAKLPSGDPLRPVFMHAQHSLTVLMGHHHLDAAKAEADRALRLARTYAVNHPDQAPTDPPGWATYDFARQTIAFNQILRSRLDNGERLYINELLRGIRHSLAYTEIADNNHYQQPLSWLHSPNLWYRIALGYDHLARLNPQTAATQFKRELDSLDRDLKRATIVARNLPSTGQTIPT